MIQTISLMPGVTLRCFTDKRFKQGCLSIQFVRTMCREEAALNALLPAVLLRGTVTAPDLRDITLRLDDLYGASVGALVRRIGDYQTMGLVCSFMEEKYALDGDAILQPMVQFLGELLLQPVLEDGAFCKAYVESEKHNLISAIESQRNDKRSYAGSQLLKTMCQKDSFGIPRLGEIPQVAAIQAQTAYAHYQRVLQESPVQIFYVGAAEPEQLAQLLRGLFSFRTENYVNLPKQTVLCADSGSDEIEQMDVTQGRLCMGFVTPVTCRDPQFAAMQVFNCIFGGGMTSKLFMQIREKMSLCYEIGSGYHSSKGILTVSAGIDCDRQEQVRQEILRQLQACQTGAFTPEELHAAKQALASQLQGVHDSPGAIEGYYATGALSGMQMTPEQYLQAVTSVTAEQVMEAAKTVRLHTVYFLRGVA